LTIKKTENYFVVFGFLINFAVVIKEYVMEHAMLNDEQYIKLLDEIYPIIFRRGPCDTSMDMIAQHFTMSKRTLYEIFGSKDDMLREVMCRVRSVLGNRVKEILNRSENIMEAMVNIFLYHQEMTRDMSGNYFRDMGGKYKYLRNEHEQGFGSWQGTLLAAFRLGVQQGVFRPDSNYEVIIRLFRIQLESLKRMEEFFPVDITLQEATNTICLSLLRSVASQEGMKILDQYAYKFKINKEQP
jgi:AcrR family transcriptional regulator